MAENIRELVLDTLLLLETEGVNSTERTRFTQGVSSVEESPSVEKNFSHRLVKAVLDKYDYLENRDKAFIKRTVEGVIERQLELDYYLNHFSSLPVRKMRPLIRCLLRMSVYQLLYMDSVPDSAVCNEACKLAAKRGFRNLKGFVNGILRTVSKQKENLPLPDKKQEPVKYLSVKYSTPEWLAELWLDEYGWEITATLLKGLMEIHPVSLRFVSTMSAEERKGLCTRMEKQGVLLSESPYLPYVSLAKQLGTAEGVSGIAGFQEGLWMVQDVSSALAVEAAGIGQGDFVVDVCAAPGGKSILAAEKAGAGRVLARDISEEKVTLLRENIRRMRTVNIDTEVFDGIRTDSGLTGKADVLFLDVPCSGLGVMGKKRDIKYRVTKEGMESLAALQRQIVEASVSYLKPGGILLYSTCTVHRGENQDMVRFISRELGLEPVSLEGTVPERAVREKRRIAAELSRAGKDPAFGLTEKEYAACIQFLPGYMETDGFFIAKFRKTCADSKPDKCAD